MVPSITAATVPCAARVVHEPTAPTPNNAMTLTITMVQSRELMVNFMKPSDMIIGLAYFSAAKITRQDWKAPI
jgi:hypothetical protein